MLSPTPENHKSEVSLPKLLPTLSPEVFVGRKEVKGFTIDPLGCRDHDDAVYLRQENGDRIVDISIADVSALVEQGSDIDEVARHRSCTRYLLGDKNDPMLPHELSEGELSIHQGVARPTITISVPFSKKGAMGRPEVVESKLTSSRSFVYEDVDHSIVNRSGSRHPMFSAMRDVAMRLLELRSSRGALVAYDLERGILSDEDGMLRRVNKDRVHARLIIQEFMILANEVVANLFIERGVPALFRNHTARDGATHEMLQGHLSKAAALGGAAFEKHMMQLGRYVNRATYNETNVGHFALQLPAYAHFTSPIRRYPDLVNQRQLRAMLRNEPLPYSLEALREIGAHATAVHHEVRDERREKWREMLAREGNSEGETAAQSRKTSVIGAAAGTAEKHTEATAPEVITPVVAARAIFQPSAGSHASPEFQRRILKHLHEHPADAHSVLNVAQMTGLASFEIKFSDPSGPIHDPTFAASVVMSCDGRTVEGGVATAGSKKQAERRAILLGLASWIGKNGESPQPPAPDLPAAAGTVTPEVDERAQAHAHPNSKLLELIQAHPARLKNLQFREQRLPSPDHAPLFACTASLVADGKKVSATFTGGGRKADVKRSAAQELLNKLELTERAAAARKGATNDGNLEPALPEHPGSANWKGELLSHCQKNRIDMPRFETVRSGAAHAPSFSCVARLRVEGREVSSRPSSAGTVKEAERLASFGLLALLRQNNN